MLAANQIPELGGETGFADMRTTFESLDAETQAELEPLSAYHSLHFSQAVTTLRLGLDTQWTQGVNPAFYGYLGEAYLRPLVKTHPKTGRKNLFIDRHAYGVTGPDGPLDPMNGFGGAGAEAGGGGVQATARVRPPLDGGRFVRL